MNPTPEREEAIPPSQVQLGLVPYQHKQGLPSCGFRYSVLSGGLTKAA